MCLGLHSLVCACQCGYGWLCLLVYGVSKKESVRALIHGLSVQTLLLVITFKIKL